MRRLSVLRMVFPAALVALGLFAAVAKGDSFTPVRLSLHAPGSVALHHKLSIRVKVNADRSVLDDRTAPLRMEVKLARECGGTYRYTSGTVLLNKQLRPQPHTGRAYTATTSGYGRPSASGRRTVCMWLVEQGDGRVWASSQSRTVLVKRPAVKTSAASASPTAASIAANDTSFHSLEVSQSTAADPTPPPIRHVFIIVLENESDSTTFAPNSPAPYLAKTLRSEGAYLPDYYGTGHESNDNYIAMISGQPPNADNQADCQFYGDFPAAVTGPYGAQLGEGCIYPSDIDTIGGQLLQAGDTWRDYNQDMGNTPAREAKECGHPGVNSFDNTQTATAQDQYATRHDPFVYFHSIINHTTLCDTHVVNLDLLPANLKKAADTPNYVFITPNLCDDGHDSPCANGKPGGLKSINSFLKTWVPRITQSPAFREQNGLLLITFDEAATSDASSCCGEIPGPGSPDPGVLGPGGGDVGAVMLSPCIKPGTVSQHPYNHYTMLRSVEDIFRLGHLAYAQLPGEQAFGKDVYTRKCNSPPKVKISAPAVVRTAGRRGRIPVRWSSPTAGSTFTLEERTVTHGHHGAWHTLRRNTRSHRLSYEGTVGQTYQFRVRARSGVGVSGRWASRRSRVVRATSTPRFTG